MNREALTASFHRWTVGSSLTCPMPRRNGTRKKRIWMSQTKPKWFVASEKIQWIILLHYTQCSAFFFFGKPGSLTLLFFKSNCSVFSFQNRSLTKSFKSFVEEFSNLLSPNLLSQDNSWHVLSSAVHPQHVSSQRQFFMAPLPKSVERTSLAFKH